MKNIKKFININKFDNSSGFTFSEVYYLNVRGRDKIDDLLNKYKYTPTKGDRLFFLPGCTVPRFKLTAYCAKHGVAVSKTIEKANVKFYGEKAIDNLFTRTTNYSWDKQLFIAFLRQHFLHYQSTLDLILALNTCEGEHVFYNYNVQHTMGNVVDSDKHPEDIDWDSRYSHKLIDYDSAILLQELIDSTDYYDQNEILRDINGGNVMDGNMHHNIKRLFNSSDNKDHKVAMECMANCDYEKSCVYLLLLFKEFGNQIYNHSARNQVNFKSLLKFFDISTYRIKSFSLDNIMTTLIQKKLLNKSNLDTLMPLAMENSYTGSNDHFKVVVVQPTPEVIQATEESILNKDCDTEIISDYYDQIKPHLD